MDEFKTVKGDKAASGTCIYHRHGHTKNPKIRRNKYWNHFDLMDFLIKIIICLISFDKAISKFNVFKAFHKRTSQRWNEWTLFECWCWYQTSNIEYLNIYLCWCVSSTISNLYPAFMFLKKKSHSTFWVSFWFVLAFCLTDKKRHGITSEAKKSASLRAIKTNVLNHWWKTENRIKLKIEWNRSSMF